MAFQDNKNYLDFFFFIFLGERNPGLLCLEPALLPKTSPVATKQKHDHLSIGFCKHEERLVACLQDKYFCCGQPGPQRNGSCVQGRRAGRESQK